MDLKTNSTWNERHGNFKGKKMEVNKENFTRFCPASGVKIWMNSLLRVYGLGISPGFEAAAG